MTMICQLSSNIFLVFLVLSYGIPSLIPSCHAATNLAKDKPYTVSPLPNYSLSAPPTDMLSLTDGKNTIGYFWTQKSTVGWQRAKTVEILIDLNKESNIGSITFNSARGDKEGGVYYPAHIAAFVGPDRDHLLYAGDLALSSENKPGSYQVKRFNLNNIDKRGRYVFLEIIPQGKFVFCDEIEVLEGSSVNQSTGSLSIPQARLFTEKIRQTGVGELLNIQSGTLTKSTFGEAEQLQKLRHHILSTNSQKELEAVDAKMLELRWATLKTQFSKNELLIQSIKPWDHLPPTTFPIETPPPDLYFLLSKGGNDFRAFSVTNLSKATRDVSISLANVSAGVEFAVYQVPFIKSAAMEYIADPLVPVGKSFSLRPGESRIMFISARGTKTGTWHHTLNIKSKELTTSIPVTAQVSKLKLPNNLSLNSVNWGYLDSKPIQDRKQIAATDLLTHHTNVVVVPPAYLPIADSVKVQDFNGLEKYLITSKGASKVLLFTNFGSTNRSSVNGRYTFMDNDWKVWFKSWYGELTKATIIAGISKNDLYFYPYDEMDGKRIDDFIAFASWARKEISGIRLYATINNKNAMKALPYLDVAQIVNRDELLTQTNSKSTELWLYDARDPAKSLSPYSYYRLMAWKAFFKDYKGIGFWAYADSTGTAWDDFDGERPDYAVIYEGEGNTIISSRRWEAWRIGIEDYELLTMYAKAKGDVAAKDLAKHVLDHPEDATRADAVRRMILMQL